MIDSREELFEKGMEVRPGGLVHPDEFDSYSFSRIHGAHDGTRANFSLRRVEEDLNVGARGRRFACFDVKTAHAERLGAADVASAGALPGDDDSFLQLLARILSKR